MKKDTHPEYHDIKILMVDGTEFKTRSTYGKKGDLLRLDIDSNTHPAWTEGARTIIDTAGRLARFNKHFSGFGLGVDDSDSKQQDKKSKPDDQ